MSTKVSRLLTALCGVIGGVTLATAFAIGPALPPTDTINQILEIINRNHNTVLLGSWLQGIGSLLIVLFVLALVHQAGAAHRFVGWVTLLSGTVLLMTSLVEVTFYLLGVQSAAAGDVTTGTISLALMAAVQHIFLIAPALLLPLGIVLVGSDVLPRVFGYLALLLGATLQILGFVGLFNALQPVIDRILIVQNVWVVAAGITLAVRSGGFVGSLQWSQAKKSGQ